MTEMFHHLTPGALEAFLDGHPPNVAFLQVINIKKIPNQNPSPNSLDKYRLQLSDSTHYQPCLLVSSLSEKVANEEIDRYCIIKVEDMIPTVIQGRKILLLKNLTVTQSGTKISHVIGHPSNLELRKVDPHFNDQRLASPNLQPLFNSGIDNSTSTSSEKFADNDFIKHVHPPSNIQSKYIPITAINPYNCNWTICARITTKNPLRKWSNSKGEGKVLGFELTDASGTIKATAFNEIAIEYDQKAFLDKVYILSKADLRPSNKRFCGNSDHDFELYISGNTIFEECLSGKDQVPNIVYCFKSIEEIKCLPKDSVVDFLGICIEVGELVEVTARNTGSQLNKRVLILADNSKHKINCTLWGTDAEAFSCIGNPIILIRSTRVSDFNTCSLNIGSNSSLIIEPNISEARILRNWFESDGKNIDMESVSAKLSGLFESQNISEILSTKGSMHLIDKVEIHTFRAMISLFKKDKEIFYKSCPNEGCQKKVFATEEGGTQYLCEKCNLEFPNYKYRYMLNMEIQDHSGSIWVTCFHEASQSIIGILPNDLAKFVDDNHGKFTLDSECDGKLFTTYYLRTRLRLEKYNEEDRIRAIVLSVTSSENVINDCKVLMKMINDIRPS